MQNGSKQSGAIYLYFCETTLIVGVVDGLSDTKLEEKGWNNSSKLALSVGVSPFCPFPINMVLSCLIV